MRHTTIRHARATTGAAALLTAALLPLLAPVPAADAADPCLSENAGLLQQRCDDTVAPTTTILTRRPWPVDGWIRSTDIVIEFRGEHTDADADPIGYQCQFFNSPTPPTTWETCTTPFTATDLEQNGATPYTFRVRAVDTADDAIDATSGLLGAGTDLPDHDVTPAGLVFRADATAPSTFGFLRSGYYDEANQDAPMVLGQSVQIRLLSNEGDDDRPARYRCRLNDEPVTCGDGPTTIRGLAPGLQRFSAAAIDPAGNVDPTAFTQQFFVPRNLTTGDAARASTGDWRTVRSPGSFGGDYLQTTTFGAMLSFPVRNVREIRLLAPAGPGLGRVEIRVGQGAWRPVRLSSADPQGLKVHDVRERLSGLVAGPLQVRVVSRGRPVRVDAVSAR